MSDAARSDAAIARGRIDADGRLADADAILSGLHARAGGEAGGLLAVPQIAALARLARRLGIVISRAVIAADGDADLDLWVRAQPREDGAVDIEITSWSERAPRPPAFASSAEREDDFLRAGADWMWETDDSLHLTAVSSSAAAALGLHAADLVGKPLTRLFRFTEGNDGGLPILTALAERRRFESQPARLRSGGGDHYRLHGVPLIDGNGRFAGFRGSASGHFESPHEASPAASDTGAFAERLGRALREPLDRIVASADTIGAQGDGPLQSDYAGYADDIATAGRHLLALVDDLVDLQAIERPDFAPECEPLDLADLARRAAGLLAIRAQEANVRIDRPADDETLPAIGDFRRALQVVMNLVGNAVRYSPDGGMVWLRVEREDDLACVIVADLGKGIDPADQDRIFEKFERVDPAEPGGTGLGLYIARRLARAMGGEVNVDSAPGQGARFTFILPAG